jgi:hypothetical protein
MSTSSIDSSVIQSHSLPYAKKLPYLVPEDEPENLLCDIKSGLSVRLSHGDYTGASLYVSRLST